jgi:hypothetical protein
VYKLPSIRGRSEEFERDDPKQFFVKVMEEIRAMKTSQGYPAQDRSR